MPDSSIIHYQYTLSLSKTQTAQMYLDTKEVITAARLGFR